MNNKFSENLRKIRKENNLSQEQLADELNVSRQAISKWESGTAYPEMDKIISLCEKFNVNMDDLLHKDIKEVKGEEESKKKINNYIDSFLKYITDTINMFSNMTFKSKVKCLFEQFIIIMILIFVSYLLSNVITRLLFTITNYLPGSIKYFINNIINCILVLFFVTASIIIISHVFKTRYLDYYQKVVDEDSSKDEKENSKEKEPISFKEEHIVIRDPKHAEYRFIKGLFKLIVLGIKFFVLIFCVFLSIGLIGLFMGLIFSFQLFKTGVFFAGLLLTIISCSITVITFLVLFLNFVLNRQSNKKLLIISFIISLIGIGIGTGLISTGALNFRTGEINEGMLKEEIVEIPMKDNLYFLQTYLNIEYIEDNIKDVKVKYTYNEYCSLDTSINDNGSIYGKVICKDSPLVAKKFVNNLNDFKIIPISSDISSIKVYASKDNIKRLKNNYDKYQEEVQKETVKRDNLNIRINELTEENKELKIKINELERELNK